VSARTARRGLTGLGLALALGSGLTGCTLPDVGMSPGLTEEAATQAATSPPEHRRSAHVVRARGGGAGGTRRHPAGR
jgi:hypothetical protein